jgi:ribosomal protein S18 acetylase RimI-like enzyme
LNQQSLLLIREVRPSDFDDLFQVSCSFYPEVEADPSFGLDMARIMPSRADEQKWFSKVLEDIEAGNMVLLVAEVDSRVIGWCDIPRKLPGHFVDHRASLGIYIQKEFRGHGIGKALLRESIEKSRGKFESIELQAFSTNHRAIRLYEQFGFKKVGVIPDAIKRGERYFDVEMMVLKL